MPDELFVVYNINRTLIDKGFSSRRFFEMSGLWLKPEIRVVIVGERPEMEAFLRHRSLRNTKHALYLAYHLLEKLKPDKNLKRLLSKKGNNQQQTFFCTLLLVCKSN